MPQTRLRHQICLSEPEVIELHDQTLSERFLKAWKIPGTRENHAIIPCANGLQVSRFSGTEVHYVHSSSDTAVKTVPSLVTPSSYVGVVR